MGYSHYYFVSEEFNTEAFAKVATDFEKMIEPLKHLGIKLGDVKGKNESIISPTEICFNGQINCGHVGNTSGMKWPTETTSKTSKNKIHAKLVEVTKSPEFKTGRLENKTCEGDCSHEPFHLQQKLQTTVTHDDGFTYTLKKIEGDPYPIRKIGKYFQSTKTARKPYDLAVTVCLIIADHYLGDNIVIGSDGANKDWIDAKNLCEQFLGYGNEFNPYREPGEEEYDDEDSEPEIRFPQ